MVNNLAITVSKTADLLPFGNNFGFEHNHSSRKWKAFFQTKDTP